MSSYSNNQVRFYDNCQNLTQDIDFYKKLLTDNSEPLLELAIGSGRVAIELVKAGYQVTGIDISPEMLEIAEQKRRQLPEELQAKLRLIQGNMSNFKLNRRSATVLIPGNSFLLLTNLTRQRLCLQKIREHLAPGGLLVVDIFNPHSFLQQPAWQNKLVLASSGSGPEPGTIVNHWLSGQHDAASQVVLAHNIMETCDADGTVRKYPYSEILRYLYRYEMELLLELTGFSCQAIYGWYDRRPYESDSRKMIFIARKE